ncbi:U11/U12 small nuclear ribonucleoprotein 25 kDa protein-like [Lethenteron reissneri]|uniref:U11/U12 small nuclear ribonucleoprotein 25 kDa protein-like n=1 Tax=Lethenteron reissneri TaxID=7753 RepID=UPI002AB773F7|nr:U11/U12 small nuclear ribonucleoprotein 25 kDa protein-like [Lethenteron reissneri]XP_061416886.1 U11/U12 small nuclear ribonucleoprotein 25 kDa protein-like [Lethenteron reissneri]
METNVEIKADEVKAEETRDETRDEETGGRIDDEEERRGDGDGAAGGKVHEDAKREHDEEDDDDEEDEEDDDDEEDEEKMSHTQFLDVFQEGMARILQDPLLCDLPVGVTLEEIRSQIALEHGRAMTVRVVRGDGDILPVVVQQDASVLDLKKALRRHMQLKMERESRTRLVSWRYVWRTYHMVFEGHQLLDDSKLLKDYGIRNRDEVTFGKTLRKR